MDESKLNLTRAQTVKLKKLLDCISDQDVTKFHLLMEHAESIDQVMKTATALGTVGKLFRAIVLWLAGLLIALGAVNLYLKDGLKGWING